MNSITVKIAGVVAEIAMEYFPAVTLYRDFRTEEIPMCQIKLADEDIDFNAVERDPKAKLQIKTPNILGKFSVALLDFNTILMHGAALAMKDSAFVFSAPSGTGKTTHIFKWLDHLPEAFVINGDKPFIKINGDDMVFACGSPWAGKEHLYSNTMIPLKSIILMERAEDNHIEQISFAEAFPFLLQQVYRPEDEEKMRKTLRLMQRLGKSVTFWRFHCNNFKDDCFQVAYEALVGDDLR